MTLATAFGRARRGIALGRTLSALVRDRASLVSMFDQALVSGFGFAVGIGAARIVGIEEFGRFVIALIFVSFFQALHNTLFVIPLLSLAGRRANRSRAYFATLLVLSTAFAVLEGAAVMAALLVFFGLRDGTLLVQMAAAGGLLTVAQCIQLTMRRAFFARGDGGTAFAMDGLRALAFGAAVAILVIGALPADAALMLWVQAGTALIVIAGFVLPLWTPRITRPIARAIIGRHWDMARWLVSVPIITMGQDTVMWVFAGLLFGDAGVGGLRAVVYLFGPVAVLIAAIENIVPVRAAAAYRTGGLPALRRFLLHAGAPLAIAVAGFMVIAIAPARFWLYWIFGPDFVDYGSLTVIVAVAIASVSSRDYLAQYFRAVQQTRAIFFSFVVGAAIIVTAIYPLSLWLGLTGTALAVLVGQSVSLGYLAMAAVRHYRRGQASAA